MRNSVSIFYQFYCQNKMEIIEMILYTERMIITRGE